MFGNRVAKMARLQSPRRTVGPSQVVLESVDADEVDALIL
jgi:hypothetical protein